MANINRLKAWVRYDGKGRLVGGGPILQESKPKNGDWVEIPYDLCCQPTTSTTTTSVPLPLRMLFSNILEVGGIVGDVADVANWNTYFDLPTNGVAFTSVSVTGDEVKLYGGSNITLKDELFDQPDELGTYLLEIQDTALCVIAGGYDSFGGDNNSGCPNLTTAIFPAMVTAGDICFSASSLVNVDFSSLTTAGSGCFQFAAFVDPDFPVLSPILVNFLFADCTNLTDSFSLLTRVTEVGVYCFKSCTGFINLNLPLLTNAGQNAFSNCTSLTSISLPNLIAGGDSLCQSNTLLTTISLPSCVNLGSTVGNNFVFGSITGNTITLTVPSALMTANAGNPDGDIVYLQNNNTVTIVTV